MNAIIFLKSIASFVVIKYIIPPNITDDITCKIVIVDAILFIRE
jgi:hypothetical protein|tara:strand:- start:2090 stop:2221 length:132 start_codon:yes stop_codon:yes gene_type:complete